MSKYGSGDVPFLFVDGFELKGVETVFSPDVDAELEETTGFGVVWREHTPVGMRKATLSQSGFFDDAVDSVNAAFVDMSNTQRIVGYGVAGNVVGRKATGLQGAFAATYSRLTSVGALHKANVQYVVTGQVDEGVILQELESKTADWDTEGADSVDNAASSANGGVGYLFVKSLVLGGHTNLTVKIRHSADDTTYADLITFTAVTATRAAERKTVAGTVNRHLAVSGDFTGAGSPTAEVVVIFARS